MPNKKIVLQSLLHALGVFIYVFLIATIMNNGERLFGAMPKTVWGPVAFLSLFVVSAAITGSLVVLRPAMWYYGGQKREALQLLFSTIAWLAIMVIIVFICLIVKF